MHYSSYQDILQDEFQKILAINPSFSMRAFAAKLDLAPSRLSEILRGKQGLSLKAAQKVTSKLKLDKHRKKYFELLVQSKHAKSQAQRERAAEELADFVDGELKRIPLDQWEFVSGWYHHAILELVKTHDVIHSSDWMSKRLKISKELTESAIARLKRLDMLGYKEGKFFAKETNPFTASSEIPSETIRSFHKQLIEKATVAVESQTLKERSLNSLIIAINEDERDEINKKISEFFERLNIEYSQSEGIKTKVYALTNQFFEIGEKL